MFLNMYAVHTLDVALYSYLPVSKNGEESTPNRVFGAGCYLLFYPTGIRL